MAFSFDSKGTEEATGCQSAKGVVISFSYRKQEVCVDTTRLDKDDSPHDLRVGDEVCQFVVQ
ncbi:MAG: hypothetical protein PHH86_06995, partial [Sphaerochaetaceae bacterium]|nr:hypothetical protein [Sphaerochaetaceae bacterium]